MRNKSANLTIIIILISCCYAVPVRIKSAKSSASAVSIAGDRNLIQVDGTLFKVTSFIRPLSYDSATAYFRRRLGNDTGRGALAKVRNAEQDNAVAEVLARNQFNNGMIGLRLDRTPWRWVADGTPVRGQGTFAVPGSQNGNSSFIKLSCAKDCISFCQFNKRPIAAFQEESLKCQCFDEIDDEPLCGSLGCSKADEFGFYDATNETYDHWATGRPQLRRACAAVSRTDGNLWVDRICTDKLPFLCQYDRWVVNSMHIDNKVCFDDKCFALYKERLLSFDDAQQYCKDNSGDLAKVDNFRRQLDVERALANFSSSPPSNNAGNGGRSTTTPPQSPLNYVWIGARNYDYVWPDGTSPNGNGQSVPGFTNWDAKQPDYTFDCVGLENTNNEGSYKWRTRRCDTGNVFVASFENVQNPSRLSDAPTTPSTTTLESFEEPAAENMIGNPSQNAGTSRRTTRRSIVSTTPDDYELAPMAGAQINIVSSSTPAALSGSGAQAVKSTSSSNNSSSIESEFNAAVSAAAKSAAQQDNCPACETTCSYWIVLIVICVIEFLIIIILLVVFCCRCWGRQRIHPARVRDTSLTIEAGGVAGTKTTGAGNMLLEDDEYESSATVCCCNAGFSRLGRRARGLVCCCQSQEGDGPEGGAAGATLSSTIIDSLPSCCMLSFCSPMSKTIPLPPPPPPLPPPPPVDLEEKKEQKALLVAIQEKQTEHETHLQLSMKGIEELKAKIEEKVMAPPPPPPPQPQPIIVQLPFQTMNPPLPSPSNADSAVDVNFKKTHHVKKVTEHYVKRLDEREASEDDETASSIEIQDDREWSDEETNTGRSSGRRSAARRVRINVNVNDNTSRKSSRKSSKNSSVRSSLRTPRDDTDNANKKELSSKIEIKLQELADSQGKLLELVQQQHQQQNHPPCADLCAEDDAANSSESDQEEGDENPKVPVLPDTGKNKKRNSRGRRGTTVKSPRTIITRPRRKHHQPLILVKQYYRSSAKSSRRKHCIRRFAICECGCPLAARYDSDDNPPPVETQPPTPTLVSRGKCHAHGHFKHAHGLVRLDGKMRQVDAVYCRQLFGASNVKNEWMPSAFLKSRKTTNNKFHAYCDQPGKPGSRQRPPPGRPRTAWCNSQHRYDRPRQGPCR